MATVWVDMLLRALLLTKLIQMAPLSVHRPSPEENLEDTDICLVEGDIPCPEIQASNATDEPMIMSRMVPKDKYRLWTKRIVPYVLDAAYSPADEETIMAAMTELEGASCIVFSKREAEEDYIHIRPLRGCYSKVGRGGGAQLLSLGSGCLGDTTGTAMHELMHALGCWHEHNRPDRDDYIRVVLNNVIPNQVHNFDKRQPNVVDLLDLPYDYGSIMHYGMYDFAVDRDSATLEPLDPEAAEVVGQRERLSEKDADMLRKLYACDISECEDPGAPAAGYRVGDDFAVGQSVSFGCEEGQKLIGSKNRFCRFDGSWSGSDPECIEANIALQECNFEQDSCGWAHDDLADFQWTRIHGSTPTEHTGPSVDHTTEEPSGYYLYTEASKPQKEGDRAVVITPTFLDNTDSDICISFWYYSWGESMGALNVYLRFRGRDDVSFWSTSENEGPEWQQLRLVVSVELPVQVVFEGIVGSQVVSDIAVDDFVIRSCDKEQMDYEFIDIDVPEESEITPHPLPVVWECNFETDLCDCDFESPSGFYWQLNQQRTTSTATGPAFDHTLGTEEGHYLYTEASYPRHEGEVTQMLLPNLAVPGPLCLRFYYHMYGIHMGYIRVVLRDSAGQDTLLWSRNGNHGDLWRMAQMTISSEEDDFRVVIEGIMGSGSKSDAAIDDVVVMEGECPDT